MVDGPRFSEDEVAHILARAAELQQQRTSAGDSETGMTLAEVEAAAAEAGIDRALVRRAAGEVQPPGGTSVALRPHAARDDARARAWLGGALDCTIERVIDGEFPLEEFDRLAEGIRGSGIEFSELSAVGRTLTASSRADVDPLRTSVSVTVRDGQTRIRCHANYRPFIGGIYGGLGGGIGGGLGWAFFGAGAVGAGVGGAIALGFGFLGGVYALCRAVYGASTRKRHERLRQLADELERVVKARIARDARALAHGS